MNKFLKSLLLSSCIFNISNAALNDSDNNSQTSKSPLEASDKVHVSQITRLPFDDLVRGLRSHENGLVILNTVIKHGLKDTYSSYDNRNIGKKMLQIACLDVGDNESAYESGIITTKHLEVSTPFDLSLTLKGLRRELTHLKKYCEEITPLLSSDAPIDPKNLKESCENLLITLLERKCPNYVKKNYNEYISARASGKSYLTLPTLDSTDNRFCFRIKKLMENPENKNFHASMLKDIEIAIKYYASKIHCINNALNYYKSNTFSSNLTVFNNILNTVKTAADTNVSDGILQKYLESKISLSSNISILNSYSVKLHSYYEPHDLSCLPADLKSAYFSPFDYLIRKIGHKNVSKLNIDCGVDFTDNGQMKQFTEHFSKMSNLNHLVFGNFSLTLNPTITNQIMKLINSPNINHVEFHPPATNIPSIVPSDIWNSNISNITQTLQNNTNITKLDIFFNNYWEPYDDDSFEPFFTSIINGLSENKNIKTLNIYNINSNNVMEWLVFDENFKNMIEINNSIQSINIFGQVNFKASSIKNIMSAVENRTNELPLEVNIRITDLTPKYHLAHDIARIDISKYPNVTVKVSTPIENLQELKIARK